MGKTVTLFHGTAVPPDVLRSEGILVPTPERLWRTVSLLTGLPVPPSGSPFYVAARGISDAIYLTQSRSNARWYARIGGWGPRNLALVLGAQTLPRFPGRGYVVTVEIPEDWLDQPTRDALARGETIRTETMVYNDIPPEYIVAID